MSEEKETTKKTNELAGIETLAGSLSNTWLDCFFHPRDVKICLGNYQKYKAYFLYF